MPSERQSLVSVVVPVLNEAECLPRFHAALCAACDALPYRFEFVFVEDDSIDATVAALAALRRLDGRVRYLLLSRNFGHQAALCAGLEHAAGDAVIMMDGDLQHPPELIPRLLDKWCEGYEVVNTVRVESEAAPFLDRLWSWVFYRVFNRTTTLAIEPGGADFRLMARVAVDALNALPERHRFVRGLVRWIGFRQTMVPFRAPARFAGRSKYTFARKLRFALEGLTAFSFYPLRLVSALGWVTVLLSMAYGLFAITAHLLGGHTVPGWTSLIVSVVFFGGAQMTVAGILGEYIGRTFEQVLCRPVYIVRESVGLGTPAASPLARESERAGGFIPPHHLARGPKASMDRVHPGRTLPHGDTR
jgi:dolichol-phosphate mannosyltransferase